MPINPNIILGVNPVKFQAADPLEATQKSLALQHLMGQQDVQAMQLRQAQRAEEDDNVTREAFKAGGDRASIVQKLLGYGQWKAAQALEKAGIDTDKAKSDLAKSQAEALDKSLSVHRGQLTNVNTPEQAAQWVAAGYADPVIGGILKRAGTPEQVIARIPADPQGFADWKNKNALGIEKYIEQNKPNIHMQNLGDRSNIVAVPGLGGAPQVLSSSTINQSADSKASNETTRRGQNMTDARARETLEQGRWANDLANGVQVNMATGATRPITANGQPIQREPKLTEDQGKATGWLVQADNAFKNMQKVGKTNPDAMKTGLPDVVAAIPSFGAGEKVANVMRGEDRQKFIQGASSLSEALLRAATGAGVNKDEAAQKVAELTPQIGDSDGVIKQKMDAIPLYLESLKVRAGPGSLRLPEIRERGAPPTRDVSGAIAPPPGYKPL